MRSRLLAACLAVAASASAWELNLADNPSAEADRNRDGRPDGWRPEAYKSPAKLAWDKTVAHTGKASLSIQDSLDPDATEWNERTGRWLSGQRRKATAGATYSLGLWVKTQGVTGKAHACIAWWAGNHWLAESYTPSVEGTTDWKRVAVTAKAPPKATAAQIYLGLAQSRGTAWFDDVAMVQGASLPRDFRPVDLGPACNTGFTDETAGDGRGGWTDQGPNDLRSLPTGRVCFRGVPFHIEEGARACVVLRGKGRRGFPASARVPVGRACETLYFLHCCAWARPGDQVGRYELALADGSTHAAPLTAGRETFDWWRPRDTKACAVGWEGSNAESPSVGLGIFPVANPRPKVAIQSVRFVAAGADPVPILVALTTADGPAALTERPIQYEFTDTEGWYPFTMPTDDTNLDTIDLTRFLDPPAGKHGFNSVRADGRFVFEDGTRARFFGTNIGGPHAFPEKARAPVIATRLAKYGVNLLRIHAIDGRWGKLIDYERGDSRHFRADMVDRLDFFVAELMKRGIYIYFDLLDYRRFLPGDGVADAAKLEHGWHHSIKGATIFNDRMIELQKEFATKFLTHRNPYTGRRYVEEPGVAVVEITNENSVFYFRNTTLTLPVYVEELEARWNRWLADRYPDHALLAANWTTADGRGTLLDHEDPRKGTVVLPMRHLYQDPAKAAPPHGPRRVSDMLRFFFDLERRYYRERRAHLQRIGIKVPITGTNQTFCPASVYADAANDFMSRNNYWCHPNVHAKPHFTFRNRSVLRSDLASRSNPITNIASSTVVGKPMVSPEFNWPWPIEYRAECLPMMAAYACLQDWDGLLFFAYRPEGQALEWFASHSDPVRWGEFPAAAMLFHRNDVSVARRTVHVGWSEAEVFEGRRRHIEAPRSPFRHLTYLHKVRNAFYETEYRGEATLVRGAAWEPKSQERYVSDTGELTLDSGRHVFTIDAPRTRAAVGFLGELGIVELGEVSVACRTPFAAVLVSSLDGRPIASSRRVLVTAVARAENTGQAFARGKTSVPERGRPPVLAEPVDARLRIRVAGTPTAYALDPTGKRRGAVEVAAEGGAVAIDLGQVRSPWCEIVLE
ncbi:MAG: beta-galactosidase [Candidatus Brocadiia bacterium]